MFYNEPVSVIIMINVINKRTTNVPTFQSRLQLYNCSAFVAVRLHNQRRETFNLHQIKIVLHHNCW